MDPVSGRGDVKVPLLLEVWQTRPRRDPASAAAPYSGAVLALTRRQPEVQLAVWRNKQQVQIGVSPKPAHFGPEFGIVDLPCAIFLDPSRRRVRPRCRIRISIQIRRLLDMRNGKTGRWGCNFAHLPGKREGQR